MPDEPALQREDAAATERSALPPVPPVMDTPAPPPPIMDVPVPAPRPAPPPLWPTPVAPPQVPQVPAPQVPAQPYLK